MKMTINLRKVLFFLLTLCLIGSAYAQDTALKEAEVAYTKEDYAKAIELYEGILKSNGESAAVYYNLGNAYYKAGKIAPAILAEVALGLLFASCTKEEQRTLSVILR